MKTFVSPLYIQTNHYTNEKIVCALLAANENGVFFKINNDKIDFASKLSPDNIKLLVKNAFELIENKVELTNQKFSDKQTSLFEVENNFNKDYISYLSKYASGVIQFNEPKPFNIDLNETSFESLFEKFVGKELIHTEIDKTFTKSIKKSLNNPKLKDKADINYSLVPKTFTGLLKKATVSVATLNGSLDLYQAVDFNNSETAIAHKLYELLAINDSASKYAKQKFNKKTNTKLIAVKPTDGAIQKSLFDSFYKNSVKSGIIELLDPSRFDKDLNKIISTEHKKLSESI